MNYRIQAMDVLLCEDCILKCYSPLIPYKEQLVNSFLRINCPTRDHCLALTDDELINAGLPDDLCGLFRRFLRMYDYKGKGLRDIPDAENKANDEVASLLELMRLPGVKAIRAQLYYRCGLQSLQDFASPTGSPCKIRLHNVSPGMHCPAPSPCPRNCAQKLLLQKHSPSIRHNPSPAIKKPACHLRTPVFLISSGQKLPLPAASSSFHCSYLPPQSAPHDG